VNSTSTAGESLDDFRSRAREWLAANLEPRDTREKRQTYQYDPAQIPANRRLQRRLYEAGLAGLAWPAEFGGQGLTPAHETAFRDLAAGYIMPDFGPLSSTTFNVNVPTMLAHGSAGFLRGFVPQVLAGDRLVCQFFSEPSSGSDLAGARTTAVRDGDAWVLNGQKTWSTYAHHADWGMCLARTDWDAPKHRGLTWFAVPVTAAGVTVRQIHQIDGSSSFCDVFFEDVRIPDANRIGATNEGWTVTQTVLVFERGARELSASPELGAPGDIAPDLVRLARMSGRLSDPQVRQKIALAHTIDFVERALAWRIAQAGRAERPDASLASYGKLFRGTYNPVRGRLGLEIGGAAALIWNDDDAASRDASIAYLNGRRMSIAGGTNEMQRNGISERILGLPRERSDDLGMPYRQVRRASGHDRL
jgi:alkylation response protein AidB-like acyl-CoA dehydrogenase